MAARSGHTLQPFNDSPYPLTSDALASADQLSGHTATAITPSLGHQPKTSTLRS